MNTKRTWLLGFFGLATTPTLSAATTMVDWLKLASGGLPSSFQLVDDNSVVSAGGSLSVVQEQGAVVPSFPAQRTLAAPFWSTPLSFVDSVTGMPDVSAVGFRVAPASGKTNYTVQFSVPEGKSLRLLVGDLFRNATAQTEGVSIRALSDSVSVPVTLVDLYSWDNGASAALNQNLLWNETTGLLNTVAGSLGESKVAFFEIGPIFGPNPRVTLSVPQGYALGTGDTVIMGIGVVVPEPSVITLLGICGVFGLTRRRRM